MNQIEEYELECEESADLLDRLILLTKKTACIGNVNAREVITPSQPHV